MRQKRAKTYRKLMHSYCMTFGFRQPYQVLVDSEMCREAIASKFDLTKQLANVLQGTVKPMITQCSIHSLYLSGKSEQPAVDLAKTFERRRCNHREAKPEEECIRDVIGATNTHRYVFASQSPSLRQYIRLVPGTPIVHVKRSVIILEPESVASERVKRAMEEDQARAESSTIAPIVAAQGKAADVAEPPKKKHKGPKGPNPLSVKKKKPKVEDRRPDANGKGKQKEQTRKESAGDKRKRSDNDEGDDEVDEGLKTKKSGDTAPVEAHNDEGENTGGGRKRRRRHKNKDRGGDGENKDGTDDAVDS
ncbi:hypothetical protein M0805_000657 [Coniferiporia weirii]|nr:hypothetical protein M0805_000657 [Coniferiporia weirii]